MLCVRLQKCCFDFETSAHSIRPRLKTRRPNFHLWVNCSFNVLWKSSGGPWICLGSQGVKNSTATITFPRNSEHASRCRLYRVNDAIFHKKHPSNLNHSTCGQTLTLLRWFMMCCPRVPSPGPLWYRDFKRSVSKEHNKKKKSALSELPTQELLVCCICGRQNERRLVAAQCTSVTSPCPDYCFRIKPAHRGEPKTLSWWQLCLLFVCFFFFTSVQLLCACLCLSFLRIADLLALI